MNSPRVRFLPLLTRNVFARGMALQVGATLLAAGSARAAGTVIFKKDNATAITTAGSFSTTSGGATDATTPGTGTGSYTGSTGSTTANPSALILKWDSTVTGANSVSTATAAVDGIIIANPGGLVTITPYTSTGQTLTIGVSGIDMSAATQDLTFGGTGLTNAGTIRIGPGVNTGIAETWNVTAGRTLTVNSALNGSQAGTSTLTFAGAGNVVINGAISQTSGAVSKMTVSGTTVTFNGASNTTSGATTITSGTLNVGNGSTGGFLGSGAVANSGTLNFNHSDSLTVGNAVTGAGVLAQLGAGTLTLNGSVAAGNLFSRAGTTVVDTGGTVTLSSFSGIGISAGETAIGTVKGTGILNANNDFNVGDTGSTTVAATGTLNIQDSGAVNIGTAGGFYIGAGFTAGTLATGTVSQTGGVVIANNTAAGTFVVGGRNSTGGTGTYNLTGGFLTTKGQAYVGGQGTGTLNLSGTGSYFANGGLLLGSGASASGTVNLDAGGTLTTTSIAKGSGTGTFNFNGGTLATGSATATALMTGLTTANVRNGGAIIDTGTANATIGQSLVHSTITGDNATDGGLTKLGSGTLTLSVSNTYTGDTTITNGQITMGANDSVGTGTVRINGGTLRFNSGGALANNVNLTAATGFISQNSSDTLNGTISSSGAGLNGTLNLAYSGASVVFNLGNGTTGLSDFHGTLALVPQSGVTAIGALRFTSAAVIGTGADTTFDLGNAGGTISNTLGNSPSLTFKFGALTGGASSFLIGSNANVNRTDTFEIGAKGISTGFAGTIGNGTNASNTVKTAVNKVGIGTLTLTGNNTFTGATTVSNGTLSAAATGALGATTSVTVNTTGTLLLAGAGPNRVNDAAGLTLAGGTFNTGGLAERVGALTLSSSSTVDLVAGMGGILEFGGSSTRTAGILAFTNYDGADQIFFYNASTGTTAFNLDPTFLSNITINGSGVMELATGEIVPVPEPATVAAGLLALGALGCSQRRRFDGALASWLGRRRAA